MCIYDIYRIYVFIGVYIYWHIYIYIYMHITIYWFIKTFYPRNHHHTQQLAQPLRHTIRSNRPKCTKAVNIYIGVGLFMYIYIYVYVYIEYSQEKNNNIFRKIFRRLAFINYIINLFVYMYIMNQYIYLLYTYI